MGKNWYAHSPKEVIAELQWSELELSEAEAAHRSSAGEKEIIIPDRENLNGLHYN